MRDNDNVVLFPGTIKRLLSDGLSSLEAGDFQRGLQHFNHILDYDDAHEQAHYGRLVCLLELGYLEEGKQTAKDMLHAGMGEYYEVLFFYVSALVQLGEWDAVVHTIERLQKQGLPAKYAEQFYQFLATAQTMRKSPLSLEASEEEEADFSDEPDKDAGIFALSSEEQWRSFQQLKQLSWPRVKSTFQAALVHDHTTGMLKTLILLLLKDWGVGTPLPVRKQGREKTIIPTQLDSFTDYESERKQPIFSLLEETLAQENPMLYETAQSILEWLLMEQYPFPLPEAAAHDWAAAIHVESTRYMGNDEDQKWIIPYYGADASEVERLLKAMR
ncbi:tetratricopeptide repeat protein [Natribacillus halophilus]|uniref:Tetratricopeptide repeat-containing protein n=1 Tax=Natribacillus halophilus TaxID=549003 RepID=A0A1G8LSN3_9BACI|nr:hypothetical protein [Natribacillus halophilus]SDI58731.1 hypothetical protein SAMN04488123_103257 [Natribacillus halophilus]